MNDYSNYLREEDNIKMNIDPINVPKEIEYISEWKEFEYPLGHVILDKTICGCGFTEYCLNNNIPTILCSPRKVLLENKEKQHNSEEGKGKGLREIYYFKNDYESSIGFDNDKEINTPFGKVSASTFSVIETQENLEEVGKKEREEYLGTIKDLLRRYLYYTDPSTNPFKIIVTYDSLHHVLDVLKERYSTTSPFVIVVDEFQSIFMDATFKATVELDFVEDLKKCDNVLYLSATPMLEKYLVQLDYFRDLTIKKLIWDPSRVENVRIEREIVGSINKRVKELVDDYRGGKWKEKVLSDGTIKYSKELVIFVNSIKSICDIIKKCDLKPEETNIVCARSLKNIKDLKKVKHSVGTVPLEGQPHKMFTLCTRTTYLGADFYSTCAYTVVCSDCNIQTMTVDISLDLPQILGRQRLKENVFRNEALLLYKAESKKMAIINEEKLVNDEKVKAKELETEKLLRGYSKMSEEEKESWAEKAKRDNKLYQKDYIGVSSRTGQAMFNYLVKVADQRAYDVSRREYQDEITIRRGIESLGNIVVDVDESEKMKREYQYLLENFDIDGNFVRRMKMLCDINKRYPKFFSIYGPYLQFVPLNYQNYINSIGFEAIGSMKYQEAEIIKFIERRDNSFSEFTTDITTLFSIGSKYSKKQIKEELRVFYEKNNITKTPKATDLEEYFVLRKCQFVDKELGKRVEGFEIVSLKE